MGYQYMYMYLFQRENNLNHCRVSSYHGVTSTLYTCKMHRVSVNLEQLAQLASVIYGIDTGSKLKAR